MQKMSTAADEEVTIRSVLVLVAMAAEAQPFLNKLELTPFELKTPHLPCLAYQGSHNGCLVTLVTNGKCQRYSVDNIGTTPAALAAFAAINELKPQLVINAGTAGGFRSVGAAIGDAFISTHFKHHDRRIAIPGFDEYGRGNHEAHDCARLIEKLGLKCGVVTTSNSLDHTETDFKIMKENDASVKDMEAAGIAWVCNLSSTPFFALKVVTDIVDGDRPTHEEFLENLGAAAVSLQQTLPKVLDFIAGKSLSEL